MMIQNINNEFKWELDDYKYITGNTKGINTL